MKTQNNMNAIVSKNIKKLREAAQMSQSQIAEYLNVTQANISQIENGARGIDLDQLERISNVFNVKMEEIIKPIDFSNNNPILSFRKKELDSDLISGINLLENFSNDYTLSKRIDEKKWNWIKWIV